MAKKRMQIDEFFPLYQKAIEEGLSREEFSENIGVKASTVYQRIVELNREGLAIPQLPTKNGGARKTVVEKVREMMGAVEVEVPKPTKKVKVEQKAKVDEAEEALADIFGE